LSPVYKALYRVIGIEMTANAWQRKARAPGFAWSPRNFRFDELDRDSACLPYGEAEVELPAMFWGSTIRVHGKLIPSELKYRAQSLPAPSIQAFDRRWQKLMRAVGLGGLLRRFEQWISAWPRIATPPTLEVSVDGQALFRYTPSQSNFSASGAMPPKPKKLETFRVGFRLRNVKMAEALAGIAQHLQAVPMPLALWQRMRDWQYRNIQHRSLRLLTVWIDDNLIVDFREQSAMPGPAMRKAARPGLNIIGHLMSEDSVGHSARGSVQAADAAGLITCLVRLKIPLVTPQTDETLKTRLADQLKYPVSLYHIYAREPEDIAEYHGADWMDDRYNIAYWPWETREFPEAWVRYARHFNEIWSPSGFANEAIQMRVPVPVLTMPHVIDFPLPGPENFRAKFGLPDRLFLFLFVFDLNSLVGRKNPEAVIEAFRRVASNNRATALVLKTQNGWRNAADMARLQEQLAGIPNVYLIDRTMPRHELIELMACCDAFVSLHHAEGFGLCVAEAMYLGKPVVSTDWSATAEYVTPQNGFPVRYRLVTLQDRIDVFARGTEWAEPDVEHAASCMAKLASDPQLCAALGAQAAHDMRERFSPLAIGRRYAQRLESILFW
jgi:glycosyltransferase involved in cell wall biosynthesis